MNKSHLFGALCACFCPFVATTTQALAVERRNFMCFALRSPCYFIAIIMLVSVVAAQSVFAQGICENPAPDPETQGYWHRVCLGIPASEGGLDPGREGRGPTKPKEGTEAEDAALLSCVDGMLALHGFSDTACEGMDANPPSDPCERALKQLTAVLFNICAGRIATPCLDVSAHGCQSTSVDEFTMELASLIVGGDCKQAAACAADLNEGLDEVVVSACPCTSADCGPLTAPPNGSVDYPSTLPGSEATYSCNPDFNLEGLATRTCDTEGNWSGEEPTCVAPLDADGDGSPAGVDCDDGDANNFPGNTEVCDGQDNNCDLITDEPFLPSGSIPYDGGPYSPDQGKYKGETCGTGACDGGVVICDAIGTGLTCSTLGTASSEICDDGIDNDCDGTVDEGCSLLPNGSTCAGSSECASGFCVDGVCCDTSCSGTCEACSAAYTGVSSGNCGFIHNGTDPENECSGGTACNGTGGCQECVPFSLDIMECGLCSEGTRTRACTVDGTWGPWGSCVGEFPPGTFCP